MPIVLPRVVRRALKRMILALVFVSSFVAAVPVAIVLHSDVPVARRVLARLITRALERELVGTLQVGSIKSVSPQGFAVEHLSLYDESGNRVLRLESVDVDVDLGDIAKKLLSDERKISLEIARVAANRVDAHVISDASGDISIVRALSVRRGPTTGSGKPPRHVRVWIPKVEIETGFIRVQMDDAPTVEADLHPVFGQLLISPKGIAALVPVVGVTLRGLFGADTHGLAQLDIRAPGIVRASFDGQVGAIPLSAKGEIDGRSIEAELDIRRLEPDAARALYQDWPVQRPVELHVDAKGTAPEFHVDVALTEGQSTLRAVGSITASAEPQFDLEMEAHGLDLALMSPAAPETALSASARVGMKHGPLGAELSTTGRTAATELDGAEIPPIDFVGTFGPAGLHVEAKVFEPGAPFDLVLDRHHDGRLDFNVSAPAVVLGSVKRLPMKLRGQGRLSANGHVTGREFVTSFSVDASRLEAPGLSARDVTAHGTARGTLDKPQKAYVAIDIASGPGRTADIDFLKAKVHVSERLSAPRLTVEFEDDRGRKLSGDGRLLLGDEPQGRDITAHFTQGALRATGRIRTLDPGRELIDIKSIEIHGTGGELQGRVRIGPRSLELDLSGTDLDLSKLLAAFGSDLPVRGRLRSLDAKLTAGDDVNRGHVRFQLERGSYRDFGDATLDVDATLRDRAVTIKAEGEDPITGKMGLEVSVDLAGSPLEPASWRDAVGTGHAVVASLPLSPVNLALGSNAFVHDLDGAVGLRLDFSRHEATALPDLDLRAGTHDLQFVVGHGDEAHRVERASVQLTATLDGKTGELGVNQVIHDAQGALLKAGGEVKLPLQRLVDAEIPLGSVFDAPVAFTVTLPKRALNALPGPLAVPLDGVVSGKMEVRGTARDPQLTLALNAEDVTNPAARVRRVAELRVTGAYTPHQGDFQIGAHALVGRHVAMRLEGTGSAPVSEELPFAPELTAHGSVSSLPLDLAPALTGAGLSGDIDGTFHFAVEKEMREGTPSHRLSGAVHMESRDGKLDGNALGTATLGAQMSEETLELDLLLVREGRSMRARAKLLAPGSTVPTSATVTQVDASIEAHGYDAVVLSPLLDGIASRLQGDFSSDLNARFERLPMAKDEPPIWRGNVGGSAKIANGSFFLPALGLELQNVNAHARAVGTGETTTILVDDISAAARSSSPSVLGRATVTLRGFDVVGGSVDMKAIQMPLILGGVSRGTATGHASAQLRRQPDHMEVVVDIPELDTELPKSISRQLIPLDRNPDIRVLQSVPEDTDDGDALPWRVALRLGDGVRVRRGSIDIPFRGTPTIDFSDAVHMSGTVELTPGGRVPVLGKVFVIQHGQVQFNPDDVSDPHLQVQAVWRAPDGTDVIADISGTVKNPQLAPLRSSDASLSQPQIMSLLVHGARETDSESVGDGNLSGSVARIGFNELVGATSDKFDFSVGSEANSQSLQAAVRLSDNVWFKGQVERSLSNGIDTSNNVTGTVDYRLNSRWSLSTELGTAGGSLDLLWQYRY